MRNLRAVVEETRETLFLSPRGRDGALPFPPTVRAEAGRLE